MNPATALAPRDPKPFLPRDLKPDGLLVRAVTAHVLAARRPDQTAADIVRSAWGREPSHQAVLALVERSATAPGMTTVPTWAQELAVQAVGSFLADLRESAAARLFGLAPRASLQGIASLALPRATSTGTPAWVAEAAPAPVAQAVFSGASVLGPQRKLMLVESFSRELSESTPENASVLIGQVIKDAITAQLDSALFSNAAATAVKPAGIVAGVTALTATTGGGLGACISDLRQLASAVTAAGGGGDIAYFTSVGRAIAINAYAEGAVTVYGSAFISDAVLIAVSVGAFVSAFDAVPELRASLEATIHFEDTAPQQIGTAGTPNVVAAPTRNAFQQDLIILRASLKCSWAVRVPNAAQWISSGLSW